MAYGKPFIDELTPKAICDRLSRGMFKGSVQFGMRRLDSPDSERQTESGKEGSPKPNGPGIRR